MKNTLLHLLALACFIGAFAYATKVYLDSRKRLPRIETKQSQLKKIRALSIPPASPVQTLVKSGRTTPHPLDALLAEHLPARATPGPLDIQSLGETAPADWSSIYTTLALANVPHSQLSAFLAAAEAETANHLPWRITDAHLRAGDATNTLSGTLTLRSLQVAP